MSEIKHHKVVSSLPATLQADSVYYVRTGAGFDIYVTNGPGLVVAYGLNQGGGEVVDRLAHIFDGKAGASIIEFIDGSGMAWHARAAALCPALTTTLVAAPRDSVFVPSNWVGLANVASPIQASGAGAGAQLVATDIDVLQLVSGTAATGSALLYFCSDKGLTLSTPDVSELHINAEISIPVLSTAAQRFSTDVMISVPDGYFFWVNTTDYVNSGEFTLRWDVIGEGESSDGGAVSIGVAPIAGRFYEIDLRVQQQLGGGMLITAAVKDTVTGTVSQITQTTIRAGLEVNAAPYGYVGIFKEVGTTARHVRVRRARGLLRV